MSMVIGKEARAALQSTLQQQYRLGPGAVMTAVQNILDRYTHPPEVGLPEGVPWEPWARRSLATLLMHSGLAHSNQLARWLESAGQKEPTNG